MWLWRHVAVVCVLLWMSHVASAIKGQTVRSSPDIPVTRFTCSGKPPGYYADLDTGCQVYHMCTEGGHQFSYQCPNTTLFQQRMLICAHWYQVNCSRSEQHYGANLLIGQRDKPFVNDDSRGKIIKNLLNPELLQHLGEGINRHPKEHVHSDTVNLNRALPNRLNKDGEPSIGISGINKTTFNKIPISNINTTQYPAFVAGSVLPGGTKSFQLPKVPDHSFYLRNQFKQIPQYPRATEMPLSSIHESQQKNETYVVQNSTTESLAKTNLIYKTVVPVNSIKKQSIESTSKKQDGSSNLNHGFNFDSKPENDQSNDLLVASQVNAVSSSKSSSEAPNFLSWNRLTETSEKGIVQQVLKSNFPIDEYNTFINRFDPYCDPEHEITTIPSISEDPQGELYTFINRYNPDDGQISVSNQSKEQPEEHIFINRFTLTPEEININQDKLKVDQLDNLLPPNSNIFVNPPSVEITPPKGSLDDSEDHVIELHFQDPRQNFFIPTDDKDTSKDAAPIVVTIPLKTDNKTSHMWFRTNDYKDKCTRCHPWFVTNKAECTPCVIIR